jgi:hypothetical protein
VERDGFGPVQSSGEHRRQPRQLRRRRCLVFDAFATGLGWVAMSLGIVYLFEQRSLKLWLINAGCQVVTYTLMGAVIGGWK